MPIEPEEIPEILRFLTEENRRMGEKLAPLKEGRCPKCLALLVDRPPPGAPGRECPDCGWGKHQPTPEGPEGCGLCGGLGE
jgi:hypothetical protein